MSRYASAGSRTYTGSQRAFEVTTIFPTTAGAIDAVQLKGTLVTERITDSRQDSYDRVVGLVDDFDDVTVPGQQTRSAKLPAGVSGFFGLGIYRVRLISLPAAELTTRILDSGPSCQACSRSMVEARLPE